MACSSMNEFYRDRGIFITGATGFVGKVLLEKLLHSCPDIRVIYILIREKRGKDVQQRLNQFLNSKAFDRLKTNKNDSLLDKIVALSGDITLPLCGLNSTDIDLMSTNVSVVFHVAANIALMDPLKKSIKNNLISIRHLLELCKKLQYLSVVIQVSTAFSNLNRPHAEEIIYKPKLKPSQIIELFDNLDDTTAEKMTPIILGDFPNTYIFAKHLAEYLFMEEGENLPRAIVRPGAVAGSWQDPYPGWTDSISAWGGFTLAIELGVVHYFYADSTIPSYIVPVDFCANMFITAARDTALNFDGQIKVYNCISDDNPEGSIGNFAKVILSFSSKYPLKNMIRMPKVRFITNYYVHYILNLWDYFTFIYPLDLILQFNGKKSILRDGFIKVAKNMEALNSFPHKHLTFSTENSNSLWSSLTTDEKKIYNFDITQTDLLRYVETCISGIKFYYLNEDESTLPASQRRYTILVWITRFWNVFKWILLWKLFF